MLRFFNSLDLRSIRAILELSGSEDNQKSLYIADFSFFLEVLVDYYPILRSDG